MVVLRVPGPPPITETAATAGSSGRMQVTPVIIAWSSALPTLIPGTSQIVFSGPVSMSASPASAALGDDHLLEKFLGADILRLGFLGVGDQPCLQHFGRHERRHECRQILRRDAARDFLRPVGGASRFLGREFMPAELLRVAL